jgi:microcystin-dependent protein
MSDPFVAEIRIMAFDFAPKGWAFCAGQIMPISQNTALFSRLGTMYGGDGKSTFGLPNLEGSVPIQWGQGSGLSLYDQGQQGGAADVALLSSEMPAHSHGLRASTIGPDDNDPASDKVLTSSVGGGIYNSATSPQASMPTALSVAGSSIPHNNLQPYLVLNYVIALQGIFPPRS